MRIKELFMNKQELVISLKLEKQKYIELTQLTNAINSLNHSFSAYVHKDTGVKIGLELKDVRSGSDIFNFLVAIPSALIASSEFVDAITSYFTLFNSIKKIKEQSVSEIENNKDYSKENMKDFSNIVELSNNANVTISNSFNQYQIYMPRGDNDFRDGLQAISKIKGYDSKEPIKTIYENMMIEFYQTTNTEKSIKHKAFCYELSDTAIPTIITDDTLKKEMLENPYNYRFLVDLEVYKDSEKVIKNYRAFNYRDKIAK